MASIGAREAPPAARRAHGERLSSTEDGEEAWERVSQSGQTAGSASEIGSVCGSVCGDDAALEALAEDWALIGPIGEDGPAQWDRLSECDVVSISGRSSGRSTPSAHHSSTLAERLCAGPFGGKPLRRKAQLKQLKKRAPGPLLSVSVGAAPAQGAPEAPTHEIS